MHRASRYPIGTITTSSFMSMRSSWDVWSVIAPRAFRLDGSGVQVDDLPWWWADASDINTIDLAGMPPGPHKILIELVNANHEVFPGQSKTVTFTVPKGASHSQFH